MSGVRRNEAVGFDPGWINPLRVNRPAAERRAASLVGSRAVKGQYQAAWLVKAIRLIDLMEALGVAHLTTGAVCVYLDVLPALR